MTADKAYNGPIPALDLNLSAFDRNVGPVRVVGSWWLDQTGMRMPKPCLVLLHPLRRVRAGRTVPVVIHLDDAWKWSPDTMDPLPGELHTDGGPTWASKTVRGWLQEGLLPGNPNNPGDRLRIYDAIVDSLRDLIHMPPLPPRASKLILAEVEIVNTNTGKTIGSAEIS
ncbi:hypothetical protein [Paracoccus marcusii]|uniref:hypothetical protein n=1 Tax=Paracoccus marcusii TaxID=59779 RepID=UPI0024909CAE|nr:hypothetical protein [Paracoccus marcusii]